MYKNIQHLSISYILSDQEKQQYKHQNRNSCWAGPKVATLQYSIWFESLGVQGAQTLKIVETTYKSKYFKE